MDGAKGLIVNVAGRKESFKIAEFDETIALITGAASQDVKLKAGCVYDDSLGETIRVTVIATGFPTRKRTLARLGYKPGSATPGQVRRPFDLDPEPRQPTSAPEDWSKPAFLRLKVRRLK